MQSVDNKLIPPMSLNEFNHKLDEIYDTNEKKQKINEYISKIEIEHDYSRFNSIDDFVNYIRNDIYHMLKELYAMNTVSDFIIIINKNYRKIMVLTILLCFCILLYFIYY